MADPNNPMATAGGPGGDPNPAGGTGSSAGGTSSLSDIGNFFSGITGGVSPGQLAEFGTLTGLGLYEANLQKGTNNELAGSLSTLGQPFSATGAGINSQITGGKPVSGPLGASIADQTGAAANLGKVANQYSTGQLTAAQTSQVQDFIKQQRAMVDTQLAASGNTDSSARQAAYQQIDDHAAQLTQQLTQESVREKPLACGPSPRV